MKLLRINLKEERYWCLHKKKEIFTAKLPDASPRPPPALRIGLTSSRTGHSRKTLANNILQTRGLFIYKSLSRDTAALHVYKSHDKIAISTDGINTTCRRVFAKHIMNAEQGFRPTRKKTKSIVSNRSPLVYADITFNIDSIIHPNC